MIASFLNFLVFVRYKTPLYYLLKDSCESLELRR